VRRYVIEILVAACLVAGVACAGVVLVDVVRMLTQ
jgi:hypothetical protein